MKLENIVPRQILAFTVDVTEAHLDALYNDNIVLTAHGRPPTNWLTKLKKAVFNREIFTEPNTAFIGGGFYNQGAHSYSKSKLDPRVKVGRYCSIGNGVVVIPANHPMDRLSTCGMDCTGSVFDFHPQKFTRVKPSQKPLTLTIGHDVWIGDGAMLGRGIRIGHGAVIGARAVVTKDVPPYAVVAGVPAVVKRYRFDEETVERLLRSAWWDVHPDCLAELDTTDLPAFLSAFEAMGAEGRLTAYEPPLVKVHEIFAPGPVVVKGVRGARATPEEPFSS